MSGAVKREREDSDEREEDPVPNALRKFQETLNSTFPLTKFRDFHKESRIKEVAQKEREKIYSEFMFRVVKFTGDRFSDLFKEREKEIQKALEEFLKKNTQFREASETFLEQMCLEEFKKTVELQLVMDAQICWMKFGEFLLVEMAEAVKSLQNQTAGEVRLERLKKIEQTLSEARTNFFYYHKNKLDLAWPSQHITHFREDVNFKELEKSVLTKLNDLTKRFVHSFANKNNRVSKHYFVEVHMNSLKSCLEKNKHFSKSECTRIHAKLMEIVTIADDVLNYAYPNIIRGNDLIPEEDVAAWTWALRTDAREYLSCPKAAVKRNKDITRQDWALQLTVSMEGQYYKKTGGSWDSEGLIIREQLTYEIDGINLEEKRKDVMGDTFEPELLLQRLRRIWEARKSTDEAIATSAKRNKSRLNSI